MYQTRPDDYAAFRCLAGACPQTCCAAWEIVVDPDAQDAYLRLQHPLAAKLRRVLRVDSEGDTYFAQTDGRCPFLCADCLAAVSGCTDAQLVVLVTREVENDPEALSRLRTGLQIEPKMNAQEALDHEKM